MSATQSTADAQASNRSGQLPATHPTSLITPGRKIHGISAILLPFQSDGSVDWFAFDAHVQRTVDAGLQPAINMDTGFANLIDESIRSETLLRTERICGGSGYVAGVFVGDSPGAAFDYDAYARGIEQIQAASGTPIFFQSFGLVELEDQPLVDAYRRLGELCETFYFFELGTMFAPFGRIYSIEIYRQLMELPSAAGAKHSSLNRQQEWDRLVLRNQVRPEFKVFTGNDLAIDMVMYGSDYLLGLSTFAPDAFALRDRMWENKDARFYELNDLLQYLGTLTFRQPTSAYKHSAAQFLKLRKWISCDNTHPKSGTRPDSDIPVLALVAADLDKMLKEGTHGVS